MKNIHIFNLYTYKGIVYGFFCMPKPMPSIANNNHNVYKISSKHTQYLLIERRGIELTLIHYFFLLLGYRLT